MVKLELTLTTANTDVFDEEFSTPVLLKQGNPHSVILLTHLLTL